MRNACTDHEKYRESDEICDQILRDSAVGVLDGDGPARVVGLARQVALARVGHDVTAEQRRRHG